MMCNMISLHCAIWVSLHMCAMWSVCMCVQYGHSKDILCVYLFLVYGPPLHDINDDSAFFMPVSTCDSVASQNAPTWSAQLEASGARVLKMPIIDAIQPPPHYIVNSTSRDTLTFTLTR